VVNFLCFLHLASKFAKTGNVMLKNGSKHISKVGIQRTGYAEFNAVEKVAKRFIQKKIQTENICPQ
jgi:hypothetical protein